MGSCTHSNTTLNEAIDYELGVLSGENTIIARGAGGGDFSSAYGGWGGSVWIVAKNRAGERWAAECLYARSGRDVTIKWVEESMGPGNFDVPDNVWNALPATPPNEYAATWRAQVETFKASFPQLVRKLGPEHEGKTVVIDGQRGTWVYKGETRSGRKSTVKLFRVTLEDDSVRYWRLPAAEERLRRCRVVAA